MKIKLALAFIVFIGATVGTCIYAQRQFRQIDGEAESRALLDKSPGERADDIVNEGYASYWAISPASAHVIDRQCERVAKQKQKPISEVGTVYAFVVKYYRGYKAEQHFVCIPQTDPTRPLCPDGYEYQANAYSDSGDNSWTAPSGQTYQYRSWNGLGNCCETAERIKAYNDSRTDGGTLLGSCYGPVELRTTASDYQSWLAKHTEK